MGSSAIEPGPDMAAMLAWIASLGAVTAEALACHGQLSLHSARGVLSSAVRAGALRRWQPLNGRPALYTLTAAGSRSIGLGGVRPGRVAPATAGHMMACCEVAVALERLYPDGRVDGEPAIRRAGAGSPLAQATVLLRGGSGEATHRADLVIQRSRGAGMSRPRCTGPIAVEIELTVKAPQRLSAICRAWARSRGLGGVLYVVTPAVRPAVERAVAGASAQRQITVVDLGSLQEAARSVAPYSDPVPTPT